MSDNATKRSVAQGMTRLKELLFDSEVETLEELDRRLGSIEASSSEQSKERREVARRVEQLFERAGTEERFRTSVATVLDKALNEAELRNHDEMSRAIAPLVVKTIKTELKNSQDELVDIMYPITGRMVRAFVASEIKKLSEGVNNSIDRNPMMLRLRSIASGRPMSDLAIADSQRLAVTEIFLIRRGSGELLAHWPSTQTLSNADIHVSGMLAAINDIAGTAFDDEGGSFRSFEYEGYDVHMRGSPVYLLAAKCTGVAPSGTDSILDEAFLATLERINAFERQAAANDAASATPTARSEELAPLVASVEGKTGEIYEEIARSSVGGAVVKALLFLLAVPLLAWFFWGLYTNAEEALVRRAAERVVAATPRLEGFQPNLDIGYRGKTMTVSGLVPDSDVQRDLVTALRQELRGTEVTPSLAVLPKAEPVQFDTALIERRLADRIAAAEDRLAAKLVLRAVRRAESQLQDALTRLPALQLQMGQLQFTKAEREITRTTALVRSLRERAEATNLDRPKLAELSNEVARATSRVDQSIAALLSAYGSSVSDVQSASEKRRTETSIEVADQLAAQSDRLTGLVQSLKQVATLVPMLAPKPVPAKPAPVAPVSPDETLERFARSNAIFFSTGVEYFDQAKADKRLDEAAATIKATTRLVRVIGYTDEKGDDVRNRKLAQDRADAVMADLVKRGVPPRQLVAIGRLGDFSLSRGAGAASPNRRVQFEVGFFGEARRQQ